jgi:hypothetical protein
METLIINCTVLFMIFIYKSIHSEYNLSMENFA